jgi:hypothetical protein
MHSTTQLRRLSMDICHLPRLTDLDISVRSNPLGDQGVHALCSGIIRNTSMLRLTLDLSECGLTQDGVARLGRMSETIRGIGKLQTLSLNVSRNALNGERFPAFAAIAAIPTVTSLELDIGRCDIDAMFLARFAHVLHDYIGIAGLK